MGQKSYKTLTNVKENKNSPSAAPNMPKDNDQRL